MRRDFDVAAFDFFSLSLFLSVLAFSLRIECLVRGRSLRPAPLFHLIKPSLPACRALLVNTKDDKLLLFGACRLMLSDHTLGRQMG